ncbi:SAM-dependent methyltransferase [Candidatus Saccharibacteria bacterium]|nr:SAM-dependent methyltransferase [Candidatus Saccharibacteria bacterium]
MHTGSFRDPAGFIFEHDSNLYRQINLAGKQDYEFFMSSGLYEVLSSSGLLIPHKEIKELAGLPNSALRHKIIKPNKIPFISYPYEWSFSQLKDAALLTLRIQKLALDHGMILKDASAFNVQFIGSKAIFIDTLSFRIYENNVPWDGYKQFCQHFIAPLTLASYTSPIVISTLKVFLDGIPLSLATKLLPTGTKRRWGLLAHLHLHAASQKRYDKANLNPKTKSRKVSPTALRGLVRSLEKTVVKLNRPQHLTEWGDYYDNTNYSSTAFTAKKRLVKEFLEDLSPTPKTVWDMGANDGTFSELAAKLGAQTVSFDVDYQAVESNYAKKRSPDLEKLILPLLQDFSNPSPALGWAHKERSSLEQRGPADVVMALALVHHLAIGNNSPLPDIAAFFRTISKQLIIEFIPKEDSKVEILLRGRNNIFTDYDIEHFEQAFAEHFKLIRRETVLGSQRVIYLYKAKAY